MNAPIVFVDIDGVLQPHSARSRFSHDLNALRERCAQEMDPGYAAIDPYDVGAVHYDWHPEAVAHLKALCQETGARIVVSSTWREYHALDRLRLLFRLHALGDLIEDVTPRIDQSRRDEEIAAWLAAHPEVERFVVLDDYHFDRLTARFGGRFIYCRHSLGKEEYERALAALTVTGELPIHAVTEAEPYPW